VGEKKNDKKIVPQKETELGEKKKDQKEKKILTK
jgi:hypothetical protein